MDQEKHSSEDLKEHDLCFKPSIASEINEDDYFRQSKSLNNNENEVVHKKVFETKANITFPTERIFRKNDFDILGLLGRGAYAKVVKAKHIQDNTIYAIKIVDRNFIEKVKLG